MGTSSITSDGRKILINQFKKSLDGDSDSYYLGLSGADSSTAGLHDQILARNEMHFVKTISANSFVVETYDWISGTVYNQYDNNDTNRTQFYVSNGKNEVFICIETGKTSTGIATGSSVEPSSTLALAYDGLSRTFPTSDGYLWRYLYKMSGSSVNNFKTSEFMPVQKIVGSGVIAETIEQSNLQTTAIAGEILGVAIVDGGSNYQFNPRIDLEGNGTGATFVGTISDGKIVKIVADSDNFGRILHGSGYDYAKVFPSAGNAILRPIIAPNGGVNKDPVASLCAGKIMLQNTVQNNEGNVVPLADPANDFKQVALLRNLELADSAKTLFTAQIGTAMHSFTVSGGSGIFVADEIFETPTQTRGKTFWHDNSNNRLYYVQNDSTGYGEFDVSGTITSIATSTAKVVDAIIQPDFNRYSGDLLYINNLKDAIIKTGTQTEDFRIVIDLGTK